MGEYGACCGVRYRFRSIYWARDARGDEHQSPTDESWAIGPRNQSTRQGVSFLILPGSARADCDKDFVCSVFRTVRRARCVERVPWILVHLRVPIFDFILVDHSYQVGGLSK